MMAACFALLLSSCVTNEESQSVTDIRNAKAEQLKSLAALNNAEAAAAKVLADAEAALKAAQAEAEAAKAAQIQAQIANDKLIAEAQAALLKAEAAYQEALAAQVEEEIEKAKLEYDALKAEYAARIAAAEQAKAEAEVKKAKAIAKLELVTINAQKALAEAKKELATAEQDLKDELERIDGENLVDVKALFAAYKDLAEDLIDAQETLIGYKKELVMAENDLVSAQESAAALVESYEDDILTYKKEIAYAEVRLEKLNSYVTVDVEALNARLEELENAELSNANNDAVMAYREYTKVEGAQSEAISAVVNGDWVTDFSSNPFGAEVFQVGYMDEEGNDVTNAYYEYESTLWSWITSWDEYEEAMSAWLAGNGAFEVYGMWKEGDADPVTGESSEVFVPMYGAHVAWSKESVAIDYELESLEETFSYTYNPMTSVGFIDAAAMKARIAEVVENQKLTDEAYLANMQERVDGAKADAELWANVVKAATAWYDTYVEADLAHKNAYVNSRYLISIKDGYLRDENGYIPTALYAYNQAVKAETNAKTAYDNAVAVVDGLKEQLALLEDKDVRWNLEDAVEPLVKPAKETAEALAEAEKELAAAEKKLAEAEAAVVKAEAAVEAAEIKERAAKKAYEAAAAVVTEAGDKATDAQKKAEEDALKAYQDAQKATTDAGLALAEAEAAVSAEESKVAAAEVVVGDAEVAAENAANALAAAEAAIVDLDNAIAELKKKITWAEEDTVAPKAAWDEAAAAVAPAEAALEAAKVVADELEAVLATGDLQRAYEVALAGKAGYSDPEAAWYDAVENYKAAVRNIAYYEGLMETDDSFDKMVEEWLALVDEAEAAFAEAQAGIAVVNDALKATGEAYIAYAEIQDVYEVLEAEQTAIYTVLNESADVQQAIASTESLIEHYTTSIENCEAEIATLTDPNANVDLEFAIAEWSKKVELQQTYVELLEAETAAAKAEYEAAVEAAAKAE